MKYTVNFFACWILSLPVHAWEHYGGNLAGTRFVPDSLITRKNIDNMAIGWQFRTGDTTDGKDYFGRKSSFKATPILVDNKLIFSSGFNRVYALNPKSGELLWRFDPEVDFSINYSEMFTSRGVSAWRETAITMGQSCTTRVFLGTLDARLIALDGETGKPCLEFGRQGQIDLSKGIQGFRRGQYSLTSPVAVTNDVVVVGSSIGDNGGVALDSGTVRGFDARTGKLLWRWDPIPRNENKAGWETWANNSGKDTGAANVWSVISADPERSLVFLPTTSPSPDFYGGERLGNNLYSNSLVALNVKTGKRQWHFQTVHHDLWDYDNASQPMLMEITRQGQQVPVVVLATKMGHIFVIHRETGKPVFPVEERTVPQSDVSGETSSKTQPFPVKPPPLHPGNSADLKVWAFSKEHEVYCKDLLKDARYEGIFTPPSIQGTILYPGNPGGTNWGSMASDKQRQIAVLVVNRLPTLVKLIPRKQFDRRRRDKAGDELGIQFTEQSGTPYGMARFDVWNRNSGYPCIQGPWSELVAIDMARGNLLWRSPVGLFPGLKDHPEASRWGGFNSGGPMMTSTGITFVAARFGKALVAFDTDSGDEIWSDGLPAAPTSTPMSYRINDAQYVVITAGGETDEGKLPGDYVIAYKITKRP